MSADGKVIAPNHFDTITSDGKASEDLSAWMVTISKTITISGEGSPEGVINAPIRTQYMDTLATGVPGTFMYIKTTESGDTGWLLQ